MSETPMTTTQTTGTPLPEEIEDAIDALYEIPGIGIARTGALRDAIRKYLPQPPGAVDAVRALAELVDAAAALHDRAYDMEQDLGWGRSPDRVPVAMACATVRASLAMARALLASPPAPVLEPEHEGDRWATLVTEGEANGCYPCDTCRGYRAKGRPCQFCTAALAQRTTLAETAAPQPESLGMRAAAAFSSCPRGCSPAKVNHDCPACGGTCAVASPAAPEDPPAPATTTPEEPDLAQAAAEGYEAGVRDALRGDAPAELIAALFAAPAPDAHTETAAERIEWCETCGEPAAAACSSEHRIVVRVPPPGYEREPASPSSTGSQEGGGRVDELAREALLASEEAIFFIGEITMCAEPMLEGSLIADRDSYEKAKAALAKWRGAELRARGGGR